MNLFSQYKIKNFTLQNRIVLPPMVRFSILSKDGYVNEKLVEYYEKLAEDGNGLIIVEATCVSPNGKLRDNQLGLWDDSFMAGLSRVAEGIRKFGVPSIIQLHHAGFKKEIANISEKTLDNILDDFVKAIYRAKICGFDGIEIHGAHTYLISQLNNKQWNTRKDKYGGESQYERMYFSRELIRRTKDLFDDNFILAYRMGGNEPTIEDGIEIAKILEDIGVDLLDISTGIPLEGIKSADKVEVPKDFPLNWVIYLAKEIKKHVNIPVICVNKIKREKEASLIIERGFSDFVAIGRAQLPVDFSWPKRAYRDYQKRNKPTD